MPLNYLILIKNERHFEIKLLQNADNFHSRQQANFKDKFNKIGN